MRKTLFAPIFSSLFLVPAALAAQSILTVPPQQCVWRAGDDANWAASNLDESTWKPYAGWKLSADAPHIWVRCRADLSTLRSTLHPALQLDFNAAYQLYLNGKLAGSNGDISSGWSSSDSIQTFPVSSGDLLPGPNQVNLRITYHVAQQTGSLQLFAGDESILRDRHDHEALSGARGFLIPAICYLVIGVVGFMLLGLYLSDRSRLELLLLAIVCWFLTILRLEDFCGHASVPIPGEAFQLLYSIGQTVYIPFLLFMFRLARKPIPWPFWVAVLAFCTFPLELLATVLLPAAASLRLSTAYSSVPILAVILGAAAFVAIVPYYAFWPWTGTSKQMRPVAVCCMVWGTVDAIWFAAVLGSYATADGGAFFNRWSVTLLELRATATTAAIVALLALLFREQRRVAQDRAQLAGEMASAREIQQYLIPEKLPPTPGLTVRSVYQPSREVGGDFFQVLPDPRDGGTLIVVGDVAGKGLKAGMLAALIVGAIRTAFKFTSDPGSILALLNERLQGRGLVTCLAMRIDRNGNAELANAGHIPPYINGKELALDGALPLGALPDISFPSTRLQLREGQSMLLVSDGVIEARNSAGELFGFDRTRAISTQSAEKIAQAAKEFGQDDDITVLTLTRTAPGSAPVALSRPDPVPIKA